MINLCHSDLLEMDLETTLIREIQDSPVSGEEMIDHWTGSIITGCGFKMYGHATGDGSFTEHNQWWGDGTGEGI